ncbi:Sec-independent protein translocase protein TatB [Rhizobium sp. RAF56]|jgi:sec-independent protein translocase protein TatB|uniref:Sec-independent protein translocase protein TatB n=1 Tax=Rhizobium sp. RAF56 TaxID=3233062 RepID=UPI003F969EE8
MFDIGWTELLVIAVVLIVVVGPKDLPPMLRAFGKMTTRARKVAGEFRAQFDEALREADLDDVRQTIADAQKLNPMNTLREAMDPLRQMGHDIKADLQRSTTVDAPPAATPAVAVAEPAMSLGAVAASAVAPMPVATATTVAEAPAKPKAARKPRAVAAAAPAVEIAAEKPKRAPRKSVATVPAPEPAAPKKRVAPRKKDNA